MTVQQEMIRYDRVRHINVQISRINFLKEHMHGSFEVSYVLEGCALYHRNSKTRNLSEGDLVLTNPYEPHSFVVQGEKPLVLLTVQIHRLFVRRYVERVPKLRFDGDQIASLPQEQHDMLVKLLFQTAVSYFKESDSQQFDILAYTVLLMGKLVSVLDWELDENPDNTDRELQRNRAQRLVSYIDENYRQKITLSMLAEMEGISTTYLSHFFRKAFGVSFQTYLSTQRFEKALVLMHDKSISMVDICVNCGFSDSRYLEAACQRTFGCSVAQYRARCENQEDVALEQGRDILYRNFSRKESLELLKKYLGPEEFEAFSE